MVKSQGKFLKIKMFIYLRYFMKDQNIMLSLGVKQRQEFILVGVTDALRTINVLKFRLKRFF